MLEFPAIDTLDISLNWLVIVNKHFECHYFFENSLTWLRYGFLLNRYMIWVYRIYTQTNYDTNVETDDSDHP